MNRGFAGVVLSLILLGGFMQPVAAAQWDLGDLYASPEAWNSSYERMQTAVGTLDRYKGTLATDANTMFTALQAISDARRELMRLYGYAHLKADEDLREAPNLERKQKAGSLFTQFSEKTAWVALEVQALGATKVGAFIAASPALEKNFDFFLFDTLRFAPHTLGLEAETVLASTGDVLAQPNALFQQLADAELPFPSLEIGGEKVRLTQSAYEKYRSVENRADRKRVFDAFWGAFDGYRGTLGVALTAQVMGNIFSARARRFDNALLAALFRTRMPERVYRTLVAQANAGLPTLHRYLRLRKRLLGINDDLAYYDNYPPLFKPNELPRFSLEESQRITLAALAPLGDEYLGLLKHGFAARWTDAHPRTGKASGGYMMGIAYDVHPYLLLNHNDDFDSLLVVAHEWGHAVHTLLANRHQPFEKASYSTFIAETASIGNEMLLGDYLVRNAKDRAQKLFYLGQQVEQIRTVFFRQVMLAEFELAIHAAREQGEPLSGAALTERYCTLLRHYYGEAQGVMKIDPLYCTEWAYISHFYYGFYVWQYATSLAGAAQFADAIQREGASARDRFLAMLKAGGSDYAYDIYRRAGIDLGEPAPYQALVRRMDRLLDEIEALERAGR